MGTKLIRLNPLEAGNLADKIKADADEIRGYFNQIEQIMRSVFGDNWQSEGASHALSRYEEISAAYDGFYADIVALQEHTHREIERYLKRDELSGDEFNRGEVA